jgi:hypothetical protein
LGVGYICVFFFRCWIQLERGEGEKINCGGFPPKEGSSLGCNVARSFPWKSVWQSQRLRTAFFVWLAGLGKILTLDNLRKRQVIVINRCGMCKSSEETVDHLLCIIRLPLLCGMPFLVTLGVAWVIPRCVVDLLACW